MKTPLPTLESTRIAEPGPMRWDELAGDDRTRFCPACGKHIYNLSAVPRAEAERLATRTSVECVAVTRSADGTVLTADAARPVRRGWRMVRTAVVFWTGVLLTLGCGRSGQGTRTPTTTVNPDGSTTYTDENGITMTRTLGKR